MEPQTTDLATTPPAPVPDSLALQSFTSLRVAFSDPERRPSIITNLKGDRDAIAKVMMKTLGNADFRAEDLFGVEFPLVNYVCTPMTFEDEATGEVRDGVRTILIDSVGSMASFGSEGIVRALDLLRSIFGDGPWSPALVVSVKQLTTRKSRRTYTLEYIRRDRQE